MALLEEGLVQRRSNTLDTQERSADYCYYDYLQRSADIVPTGSWLVERKMDDGWLLFAGMEDCPTCSNTLDARRGRRIRLIMFFICRICFLIRRVMILIRRIMRLINRVKHDGTHYYSKYASGHHRDLLMNPLNFHGVQFGDKSYARCSS